MCSTRSSSKRRQGNEGSKDQVTDTALVKRSIQSSGSKKKSNSQHHIAVVQQEDSMKITSPSTKTQTSVDVDKGVEEPLRETVADKVKKGKIIAHGGHEEQGVVFVNKITGITEVHDEEPEKEDSMDNTSPSTKRQKIVDDDKGVEEALKETVATQHDVAVATQNEAMEVQGEAEDAIGIQIEADAKADKDDKSTNDHSKDVEARPISDPANESNPDEQGNDDSISEYESVTSEPEEIEEDEEGETTNVDEENQDEILEEFVPEQELEVLASEGGRGCTSETKEKKGKEAVKVSKLVSSEIFTSTSSSESSSDDQNQSESGSDDSETEEKEIEPKMKIVNQRKRKQLTAVQIQSLSRLTRSRALQLSLASQKAKVASPSQKASVRKNKQLVKRAVKKNVASPSVIVIPDE
ncbi:unnamed protein product [Amaranthus hypochondriacus]